MSALNPDISVILINLDRARKRLSDMKNRCESIGINYMRISAVDGRHYKYTKEEYDEKLYKLCVGRKTNPCEIGCYLSHYDAINQFLKSGKKYAIILEDDAVFSPDFVGIANELVNISPFWDFVKFNTARDCGIFNIPVKNLNKNYKLYASLFPKVFAAAYIINRKAAQSLSEKLLPMFVPFDHEMVKFWKYGIRQFSVFPSPVSVMYEDTYIEGYGPESLKFPFYKRVSVLAYRIYMQILRAINFYNLLR